MGKSIYALGVLSKGYVEGPVKIGVAKNPHTRMKELQTGNHCELSLLLSIVCRDAFVVEKRCHDFLTEEIRVTRRGEWFNITPDEAVATVLRFAGEQHGLWSDDRSMHQRAVDFLIRRRVINVHNLEFDQTPVSASAILSRIEVM